MPFRGFTPRNRYGKSCGPGSAEAWLFVQERSILAKVRFRAYFRLASSALGGVLMTTHHPDQARLASTRVATLAGGRIDRDGPLATS